MSQTDNLSFINNEWVYGCGCGGKQRTKVSTPPNSKPILLRKNGTIEGPITGLKYTIVPNQVSIDIDYQDAQVWLNDKTGSEPLPGQKGRLTRVVYDPKTKK